MTTIFYTLIILLFGGAANTPEIIAKTPAAIPKADFLPVEVIIPEVPFYSQFRDISAPEWKKIGCGIADAAMIINYYNPGIVSVDALLKDGISSGAYISGAGWSHKGLASLFNKHGLKGQTYDLSGWDMESAFIKFSEKLKTGPAIASVYYTFDPQSPIPHLVVITGVKDDKVYYNDPADDSGGKTISISDFKKAWKKRFITASL